MPDTQMNKSQWIELFREIGLDEKTMRRWHPCFEAWQRWGPVLWQRWGPVLHSSTLLA